MKNEKQYNYCLDWVKGIACIFVVFLHCEFPGVLGVAVQAISRWCVPFFFMVSGYYCYREMPMQRDERLRKVLHILTITLNAALFYIFFAVFQKWIWGDVSLTVSLKDAIAFVCFNQMVVIVSQMWFLFALLYVYVVFLLIGSTNAYRKHSVHITTLCLILYVILAQGLHVAGVHVPNFVYKNWLIEGLGFFTLGFVIHQYQNRLNFDDRLLWTVIVVFSLLSLVERYLLGRDFGVNVCSFPQAIALFLYAINNPNKGEGAIQRLGKTCSMFVYILHPFVWHSLERVYTAIHVDNSMVALYLMPIFVLGITVILSIACYRIKQRRTLKAK